MNLQALDIFGLVSILVLAVIMPVVGVWDFRRLVRRISEGRVGARVSSYQWIIVMEWATTLVFIVCWLANDGSLAGLGLLPAAAGGEWLAVGLGLLACVFMIGQTIVLLRSPKWRSKLPGMVGELAALGPQTVREVRLFTLVSITAGVCEEIIYRGVLLAVLTDVVTLWPAVALSSVIFGLGHAYQGLSGIVKTTLVGAVFALLVVFSGSLFVAILLHITIDVTSGRLLAAAHDVETAGTSGTSDGGGQSTSAASFSTHSPSV